MTVGARDAQCGRSEPDFHPTAVERGSKSSKRTHNSRLKAQNARNDHLESSGHWLIFVSFYLAKEGQNSCVWLCCLWLVALGAHLFLWIGKRNVNFIEMTQFETQNIASNENKVNIWLERPISTSAKPRPRFRGLFTKPGLLNLWFSRFSD